MKNKWNKNEMYFVKFIVLNLKKIVSIQKILQKSQKHTPNTIYT